MRSRSRSRPEERRSPSRRRELEDVDVEEVSFDELQRLALLLAIPANQPRPELEDKVRERRDRL